MMCTCAGSIVRRKEKNTNKKYFALYERLARNFIMMIKYVLKGVLKMKYFRFILVILEIEYIMNWLCVFCMKYFKFIAVNDKSVLIIFK